VVTLSRINARSLVLLMLSAICLLLDVNTAYAQSAQCGRLEGALRQFDRNAEFQQLGGNSQAARRLAQQVQAAESRYIRDGCNDAARAGRTLTPQCQQIGRNVLDLRAEYARVAEAVDTANAVAGQREAILQELARFGCGVDRGSSATFSNDRQSVFDRVFGTTSEGDFTDGQMVDGGDYWGYQGYQTIRTLCVRLSDGFFWPISYATLQDYVMNDAQQCQAMCPNTEVELYFYDNPGQEPEQMRNVYGNAYTALPNAFRFREAFDKSASCQAQPQSDGKVTVARTEDGKTRAMIEVAGVSFPMPLRDPRGQMPAAVAPIEAPLEVANLVSVPLPRPRPAGPGETPVTRPAVAAGVDNSLRLVQFGNKTVRVVGPDTPYAQPVEAGT
jgi:hypothetical protein